MSLFNVYYNEQNIVPYFNSSDISLCVKIKIRKLLNFHLDDNLLLSNCHIYCKIQLISGDLIPTSYELPINTVLQDVDTLNHQVLWDKWLNFSISYRDLTPATRIAINIYSEYLPSNSYKIIKKLVGGTCIPLFNEDGVLLTGIQIISLNNQLADTSIYKINKTPYKIISDRYTYYDQFIDLNHKHFISKYLVEIH